jgi:tRNA pseudouridine55 synthase
LLLDKPEGPTSHDVVARARKLFRLRAVGHSGTLDPLPPASVLSSAERPGWPDERHPRRIARSRAQGNHHRHRTGSGKLTPAFSRAEVMAALDRLTGPQRQRPPAFSAKRVDGERSHRLARRGGRPEPAPVQVVVHRIELLEYSPPLVTLRAEVSPGTYIRALGRTEQLIGAPLESAGTDGPRRKMVPLG